MKKNSFLGGALISTVGIVICKIIGLVYVIPFYAIIGVQGGALYSYAYSIYNVFLNLATSGIPLAMSKLTSEFNSLGYYFTKERTFKTGIKIVRILCIISFLLLMILAPNIAHVMIGNVKGGNSVQSVTTVIRIISTAILVVPFLSVSKGYLQGHKMMNVPAIANILEQVVRVVVILLGSFLVVKVFHQKIDTAVGIAVFAATIGALTAYFYVFTKIKQNKKMLKVSAEIMPEEKKITTKEIVKKIIFYALPFVIISVAQSSYLLVDASTVTKGLVAIGYTTKVAESTLGVLVTWGSKLQMIVVAIALGLTASLIPALAGSYAVKNYKNVSDKFNQALQILLLVSVPLAVGLSFMSNSVWTVFYGSDTLNANIFKIDILAAITISFVSVVINANQTLNNTKQTIITLLSTLLLKAIFNVPFMYLFHKLGIESYYAPAVLDIILDGLATIYLCYRLKNKAHIDYSATINTLLKVILCTSIMVVSLMILNMFIPASSSSRLIALFKVLLYGVVGIGVYFYVAYKSNTIQDILGKNFISKFIKLIKKNN